MTPQSCGPRLECNNKTRVRVLSPVRPGAHERLGDGVCGRRSLLSRKQRHRQCGQRRGEPSLLLRFCFIACQLV